MLQNRSTFFHFEPAAKPTECKNRCSVKRYSRIYSQSLVRDLERTCDAMYIDEQIRPQAIPRAHNTCRGLAAVKWGPMKLGEFIHRHYYATTTSSTPGFCLMTVFSLLTTDCVGFSKVSQWKPLQLFVQHFCTGQIPYLSSSQCYQTL